MERDASRDPEERVRRVFSGFRSLSAPGGLGSQERPRPE